MAITSGELSTNSQWFKFTKTFTDFSTAALTNAVTLITVPAKTAVTGCIVKQSASFTGGIIATYTISVGISGSVVKYAAAQNVFQAVSDTAVGVNILGGMENSSIAIIATAVSTVGLLNAATAGSVDIWLCLAQLP